MFDIPPQFHTFLTKKGDVTEGGEAMRRGSWVVLGCPSRNTIWDTNKNGREGR